MNYSESQYKGMATKYNQLGFTGKLLLIKNHSHIFYLEFDGFNFFLRLHQENAMDNAWDKYFEFPQELEPMHIKELFKLIDIKL